MNGIQRTVQRADGVAQAAPKRHSALQRAADTLSRRNADTATAALFDAALARLVDLCYETDDDGQLANVDPVTGRLLIPAPWGRAGCRRWGLTRQEANVMRLIMQRWQWDGLPLFTYDRARRVWLLNLHDYSDHDAALGWLHRHAISVAVYRSARASLLARA